MRAPVLVSAVVLALSSAPARAQSGEPAEAPPPSTDPVAAAAGTAAGPAMDAPAPSTAPVGSDAGAEAASDAGAPVDPADEARHAEALARFDDAAALFERGDLRGALAEMALVYELLEGREDQYVVFYNLGRIYEELHRYDRAIDLYERYLRESPPDGEDRSDAEASLRALERLLGTLVVDVDVAAEVWIGDDLVGEAPGEIRVPAGAHTIELRAAGYEPHQREIEIAARTRLEIQVTLARLSDVHGISPAFFASTTAGAFVALGVGIGLGVHAWSLSVHGAECFNLRTACSLDGYDPHVEMQRIADFALAADVLFGATALLGATSIVLAFVTDWGGRPASAERASVRLAPSVGPGVAMLGVAGAF